MYMVAEVIRQRSKKRAKLMRDERVPFVKAFLEEHPWCQRCQANIPKQVVWNEYAGRHITVQNPGTPGNPGAVQRSTVVHEKLTRARGGSITDPENCVALCRECHDWIHAHPRQATEDGWLISGKRKIGEDER